MFAFPVRFLLRGTVYYKVAMWPAPSWLDSSVGRALHWCCRGHGFKSLSGLNFFSGFNLQIVLKVYAAHVHHFCVFYIQCMFVIVFFIGTDCKTERVGIRIQELAFKQPFENQESTEFKSLELSLLSAVSYLKHKCNVWDH